MTNNVKTNALLLILSNLIACICLGQNFETIQLKTENIEITTGYPGYFHNDFGWDDLVTTGGDFILFTNGYSTSLFFTGKANTDETVATGSVSGPYNDDYHHGLLTEEGDVIEGSEAFFSKSWIVHDYQIFDIKNSFEKGILSVDNIAEDILTWPAIGNPFVNSLYVQYDLAPFYDRDLDGIYDPTKGDYPIADADHQLFTPSTMLFNTYHDVGEKDYSNSPIAKLQFSTIQYVINCLGSDLSSTLYSQISIKNCSGLEIKESKIGLFAGVDVGCGLNTFLGVDTLTNSYYYYKGNEYDLSFLCDDGNYGVTSSLRSVTSFICDESLSSVVPFYHNPSSVSDVPVNEFEIFNVLNGRSLEGSSMTYGGSGFTANSMDTVNFPFTSFPNDKEGWSQRTAEVESLYTRNMASFDLGTLIPGETKSVNFKRTNFVWDTITGLNVFETYGDRVEELIQRHQNLLNGNAEDSCPEVLFCNDDCVWPGDTNASGKVDVSDIVYRRAFATKINEGPSRSAIDYRWYPIQSDDWGLEIEGVDAKHGDVNGNGRINFSDYTDLVEYNYGLKNSTYVAEDVFPETDPLGLTIEFADEELELGVTTTNGKARGMVKLGDENGLIATELTAMSMMMVWDTLFFEPASGLVENSLFSIFDGNYYQLLINGGYDDLNSYQSKQANQLDIAKFQYSSPLSAGGDMFRFRLGLKDNGTTNNENGIDTTYITFKNVTASDAEGNIVDVGVQKKFRLIISNLMYDPSLSIRVLKAEDFRLYPNPVTTNVISCSQELLIYKVCDSMGKTVLSFQSGNPIREINISALNSGVYFLQGIAANEHSVATRFIVADR